MTGKMQPATRHRRVGCLIGLLVGALLFGSWIIYVLNQASALENLNHLAQLPPDTSFEASMVRAALLRLIPIGTAEHDVYDFLEDHDAVNGDRLLGTPNPIRTPDPRATFPAYVAALPSRNRAITYYTKDSADVIHCFVRGDPGRIEYVGDSFYVRFMLDEHGTVQDITVEDTSVSL